nr:sugar ABC transporter substrate-binding protein [Neobacillus sp. Marseille-Q6967]
MLTKGKIIFIIGVVISIFVLGYFTESFAQKKPKVVVVLKESDSPYWRVMKSGVEKAFEDFGIDGKVIVPRNETVEEQAKLLEKTYNEKPDVMIVSPISSSVRPTLEKFTDIPVLLVDTDIPLKNKTAYIGTNNLDLGKKAGAFLASQLQPGDKIAIIGGDLSFSVFRERVDGAITSLNDAGVEIAYSKTGITNDEKNVQTAVINLLNDYPDIKGVITTHDEIAFPAIKVINNQGLTIPVIGPDGLTEMLKLITDETIPGTVAQNPYDMGYLSVETAMKVINGGNVEKFVDSGVDIIIKENAHDRLEFYQKILK